MNGYLENQLAELTPVFIGIPQGLPEFDMDNQIQFVLDFMKSGAAEFKLIYIIGAFAFKLLSAMIMMKPWSKLDLGERQMAANRLFNTRNPLIRSVAVLLASPLFMSYYRRPEVSVPLGFDTATLRAEAALRVVSRDRNLPPR